MAVLLVKVPTLQERTEDWHRSETGINLKPARRFNRKP
jgi:hypothetical protein